MIKPITELLLVVYDSRAIHETFRLLDSYLCANIINLDNPSEAIPVIERENPAMVLLCAMISKTRAYELCYEIKHIRKFAKLPVVILTLQDNAETRKKAEAAGADGLWDISISKDDLSYRLRAMLEGKELSPDNGITEGVIQEKIATALSEHCELIQNLSTRLEQCENMLQKIASNFQDQNP